MTRARLPHLQPGRLAHDDAARAWSSCSAQALGKKPIVEWQPEQPGDMKRTLADLTLSGRALGYAPQASRSKRGSPASSPGCARRPPERPSVLVYTAVQKGTFR